MPEKLHDCVESTLEDDPDKSEAQAWAICRDEIDAEAAEVSTRADLDIEAEALDTLADTNEAWQTVDGGWLNAEEGIAIYDGTALGQQADDFGLQVFQIVQAEDDEMDLDGDLMGIGVAFPNAGVYVDWRIDAWPDDEQLEEPHVSDYGSIQDLEQATGGVVEPLDTIYPAVDENGDRLGDGTDQQSVTITGPSQEAIDAIDRRYSADVTVVDGEASAAPTDHPSADE